MNAFTLPVWILNGKRYAFLGWLDSHTVSQKALDTEDYYPEYTFSLNYKMVLL